MRRLRLAYRIAFPLYLDSVSHLHHPEFRKAIPPNTQVIVYHGTSSAALASMLQHGQLSWQAERKNYPNTTPGVYVTTSPGFFSAEMYGHKSTETQGGDEVVLELQIPLGWIVPDPDDTRIDEQGNMNDLGRKQGMVTRPISVKSIKQLKVHSDELAPVFRQDAVQDAPDIMGYWTPWMPVGKFLDSIARAIKKGISLPQEYAMMVGARPRGLAKSPAPESREQELANELLSLYHTMIEINLEGEVSDYDKTLWWVHRNKFSGWEPALKVIQPYFTELGGQGAWDHYQESYQGTDYWPKPGESVWRFLKRL